MHVGIAGLGRMGAAIGARLLETGHQLTVWNRTAEKLKPLTAAGAVAATTPAGVTSGPEIIISMLTDGAAVDAVYGGPQGLLAGDCTGKLFVDMSTVRPHTTKALAAKVRARGAAFLECPVGGSTGPARAGKLLGLAGGEKPDFERATPLLGPRCRRLEQVGPVGAGASMKLAINLPLLVFWRAFAEALSLVEHLGADPAWLVDLFSDTSGGPSVLKARGPALIAALSGKPDPNTTFDIDSIRKDLRTMIEEGKSLGRELPLVARALEFYDDAARDGWGRRDVASLMIYWLDGKKTT